MLQFQPIAPEMRELVLRYTTQWHLNSSEYTFTNLLMWGTNGRIKLAEHDNALFFLLKYGKQEAFMFAPLTLSPQGDYVRAVKTAEEYCLQNGITPLFKAISGLLKDAFSQCEEYELFEDRDNYDYVYRMEDLLTLSGKKLHAKRNHINQFRARYAFEYVEIMPHMLEECMEVYRIWLEGKDVFEPGVLGEMEAIRQILMHMEFLGVKGGGIRIGGRLVAFTLGEKVNNEMAVIHIEKADGSIPGLYTIINQQFIEHEFTDVKLINREEDMGLEGLRRAKLSYYPTMLLEKYEGRRKA